MTASKKELVHLLLQKGVLVTPELLQQIEEASPAEIDRLTTDRNFLILSKEVSETPSLTNIDWKSFEQLLAQKDRGASDTISLFLSQHQHKGPAGPVQVNFSYPEKVKKPNIQDVVGYFSVRYRALEQILSTRAELTKLLSISKVQQLRERSTLSVIAMITDIQTTKTGNKILILEDPTGTTKAIISKNNPALFSIACNLVPDQVIALTGQNGTGVIFATSILEPDVPLTKEFKKSPDEAFALFLSDLHVGSRFFLENEFRKFLSWLNQISGTDSQKALAAKVKYIFIVGDLVDGVGIYPKQEAELTLKDIYAQYEKCAELLSQIPPSIHLIICPGNHDALRLSEPQPPLPPDLAAPLYKLPNAILVSNPSSITIHTSAEFPGFDILLYHGYSFDHYIASVDSIRNSGGYDRADLIMKFLLQKRHLAPTYGSTLCVPDPEKDNLIISKVPDFFVTGHIHKISVSHYRNITLISGSCWQSTTSFQEKLGHHPEPCRVPLVNLKTRQVKVLRFGE